VSNVWFTVSFLGIKNNAQKEWSVYYFNAPQHVSRNS
jgi:hypothetical protein